MAGVDDDATDSGALVLEREERGPREACLVVIYGTDLGRRWNIKGKVTLGRGVGCDIVLPYESASREHAQIELDVESVRIRDLDSTNGTFLNDHEVKEAYLSNGDRLQVGRTIFRFLYSSELEHAYHEEVFRLSTVDGLTGARNRRYLHDALSRDLSRALRYERPLSALVIDVDGLTFLNDKHGRRGGDHLLGRLARLIEQRARRVDLLARWGADEFFMVLPETPLEGARIFSEQLRELVQDHEFHFEGDEMTCTISIGVTAAVQSTEAPEDMIQRALKCLDEAQRAGGNRVVMDRDK